MPLLSSTLLTLLPLDDPEIYDGAHVSVQLLGRRLQEERMILLAEYFNSKLKA